MSSKKLKLNPEKFEPDISTLSYDESMHLNDMGEGKILPFGSLECCIEISFTQLAERTFELLARFARAVG